jgi:Haloacid dehalogenase-like hydrolase
MYRSCTEGEVFGGSKCLHSCTSAVQGLDVFMAGDDVPKKKPDPSIYRIGAERLELAPAECLVIEDSTIGLRVCLQIQQSSETIKLLGLVSDLTVVAACRAAALDAPMLLPCCMPRCIMHYQCPKHRLTQAALGAGMRCMITCTSSTAREAFEGAERIFGESPELVLWRLIACHLLKPPRRSLRATQSLGSSNSSHAVCAVDLPDDLSIAQLRDTPAEVQDMRQ